MESAGGEARHAIQAGAGARTCGRWSHAWRSSSRGIAAGAAAASHLRTGRGVQNATAAPGRCNAAIVQAGMHCNGRSDGRAAAAWAGLRRSGGRRRSGGARGPRAVAEHVRLLQQPRGLGRTKPRLRMHAPLRHAVRDAHAHGNGPKGVGCITGRGEGACLEVAEVDARGRDEQQLRRERGTHPTRDVLI
jgi:hypothetical protein